jgi:hypothetical protein
MIWGFYFKAETTGLLISDLLWGIYLEKCGKALAI